MIICDPRAKVWLIHLPEGQNLRQVKRLSRSISNFEAAKRSPVFYSAIASISISADIDFGVKLQRSVRGVMGDGGVIKTVIGVRRATHV